MFVKSEIFDIYILSYLILSYLILSYLILFIYQNDPYMDYGHDPVLRQEKVVIRIQPSANNQLMDAPNLSQQPDVTIFSKTANKSKFPDVIASMNIQCFD